jgi:hypothetical protein
MRIFLVNGLRRFANAYNLLTFTGVKFVDPEHRMMNLEDSTIE